LVLLFNEDTKGIVAVLVIMVALGAILVLEKLLKQHR
jgi:hypothetical protein